MMHIQLITALIVAALFTTGFASETEEQRELQVDFDRGDQCRCQAPWETFYSRRTRKLAASQQVADEHKQDALARQLQRYNYSSIAFRKNLFTVEDVYVLPPAAPQCASTSRGFTSSNNKHNLRHRRVDHFNGYYNRKSSGLSPLQVNTECATAKNGVPLCCFSDSASTCDCDCPAIPETFDCPVIDTPSSQTRAPASNTVTGPTEAPTMQIITNK